MNFIVRYLKSRHPFEYSQITDQLYVAACLRVRITMFLKSWECGW